MWIDNDSIMMYSQRKTILSTSLFHIYIGQFVTQGGIDDVDSNTLYSDTV